MPVSTALREKKTGASPRSCSSAPDGEDLPEEPEQKFKANNAAALIRKAVGHRLLKG
jgi:hypothetical protein